MFTEENKLTSYKYVDRTHKKTLTRHNKMALQCIIHAKYQQSRRKATDMNFVMDFPLKIVTGKWLVEQIYVCS